MNTRLSPESIDAVVELVGKKYKSDFDGETINFYLDDIKWEGHLFMEPEGWWVIAHSLRNRKAQHDVIRDFNTCYNPFEIAWKLTAFLDEVSEWAQLFGEGKSKRRAA